MKTILVTGPDGYIGGRLVPRLLAKGYKVRCLTRNPEHLSGLPWSGSVEVFKGDVSKNEGLEAALAGTDAAYYLVHSMSDAPGFEKMEESSALNFAKAASAAGCGRVVYLGGLGKEGDRLSRHLISRHRVGEVLRSYGPPVTEFRAAIIVGSGSVSFEMIRYLVERLPVIPTSCLLQARCQPLAVRDALAYLAGCLEKPETAGRIIEIGGSTAHCYEELLRIYADIRGLKRRFINFRHGNIWFGSAMVGLITPLPRVLARPLLESLSCEVTCSGAEAAELFPEIKPMDYATAVKRALIRLSENAVETSWTAAYTPSYAKPYTFEDREGLIRHAHVLNLKASAEAVFKVFTGIGGGRGWFYWKWLWELKALQDRFVGGVGMRLGRRHPDIIRQGEVLDFWRVERVIEGRMMLLRAEMRLPGKGWLQFEAVPAALFPPGSRQSEACTLRLTAYFEPRGLFGNIYWYALYPAHVLIFRGLALEIKRRAEALCG
ncbi:MAG: SDR family oxidoreductase [Elusimicrobiota bacterium]|nr:SDR family oxidoreductase [Elusimicrobiota bacterium]